MQPAAESAIAELQPIVDRSPLVQQLKQAIQSSNIGTYREFVLGFDQYVIRLERDSGRSEFLPADRIEGYRNLYAQHCGSQQRANNPQALGYVWVGTFEINAEWADGLKKTFVSKDTLGIYSEADFDVVREEEIKHRQEVIRWFLEQQEIKLLSIQLKSVEKMDLPKDPIVNK